MAEPLSLDLRERVVEAVKGGCRAAALRGIFVSGFRAPSAGSLKPKPVAICARSRWAGIVARRRSRLRPKRSCRFWPNSRTRRWPSFRMRWRTRDIASACRRSGAFSVGAGSRSKKVRTRGRARAPRHSETSPSLVRKPARSRSGKAGLHRRDLGLHQYGAPLWARAQRRKTESCRPTWPLENDNLRRRLAS